LSLLSPAAQVRYETALQNFADWVAEHDVPWPGLPEEIQDFMLSDYILSLRDECEENLLQRARETVAALQKIFPRRRYTTAWHVIRGWSSQRPPQQAPPLPKIVAFAVVTLLAAVDQLDCAMAILIAYCGLLRIGEALNLTCDAVVFGHDFAVLHLGKTKRGKADRVVLADPGVVSLLRRYVAHTGRRHNQRLFWCSYSKLRVWLKKATDHLGFTDVAFRSHSLRRGAATELFAARVPLERIMMFGRWASESNCRLYLHRGEVALISTLRSQRQWALIEALARLVPQVLVDS